ncbi:MAG: hypothetical protein QXZ44_05005 [Ferroplasma sp.]
MLADSAYYASEIYGYVFENTYALPVRECASFLIDYQRTVNWHEFHEGILLTLFPEIRNREGIFLSLKKY